MSNMLSPGLGGQPAPSPKDQAATPPGNPLGAQQQTAGASVPPHLASAEDQAAAQYQKVEQAAGQLAALRAALDKLAAFGDTVTMDDLVEAAGGMVAAGIPAVQVAASLAEAPEQQSQLPAWVQEKSQQLAPQEAQMAQVKRQAGWEMAKTSTMALIGHSAEQHYNNRRLAAMTPAGRA